MSLLLPTWESSCIPLVAFIFAGVTLPTAVLLLLPPQYILFVCCGRKQCQFDAVTLTGNCPHWKLPSLEIALLL